MLLIQNCKKQLKVITYRIFWYYCKSICNLSFKIYVYTNIYFSDIYLKLQTVNLINIALIFKQF